MTSISKLDNVAAAAGGLTLTDRTVTGTVPSFNTGSTGGGGGFGGGGGGGSTGGGFTGGGTSSFKTNSFVVSGVDLANGELGPLSTGTISSGRTFTSADATKDVALVDSSYATTEKLKVGSTIDIGNSKAAATKFTVVGIVTEPAGDDSTNVYIPLTVAQSLSGLKNDVNTIYVSATSGSDITSVADAITKSVSGRDHHRPGHPGEPGHRLHLERVVAGQQPRQVARDRGPDRGVPARQPAHHVGRVAADP